MTPEMMTDFSKLKFLAIGANSFVCDCSLREFIERAAFNAKLHQCRNNKRAKRSASVPDEYLDPQYHYEVFDRKYYFYLSFADESCKNIINNNGEVFLQSIHKMNDGSTVQPENCDFNNDDAINSDISMSFEFLLLDYNENDYHCVESDGLSKRKVLFNDINACASDRSSGGTYPIDSTPPYERDDEMEDDLEELPRLELDAPFNLLIVYLCIGIPLTIFATIWFWKRRDIKYFCAIFKNTLILSLDKDDKKTLMMTNRRQNSSNYTYDVFVSYCDKDRPWVLDHFIPNIESRSDVTICLHERDFQVGLSILENIIQCMDQSRCLLLVISESFLKSNWCSFEMHLAQHRLDFENLNFKATLLTSKLSG